MIVYRLARSKYKKDLSGKGAAKSSGRWNSKGVAILYTSESRALCTAEAAVHIGLGNVPGDYYLVTIEIKDDASVKELKQTELPRDWKSFPHPDSTQQIGDEFVQENKFLILKVPSVVVQGDHNYLINPDHKERKKIKIIKTERFAFDKRMFGK
ncbi:MAG: RES family NAD+ phosphorylase [Chitinophagales bacterium]